MKTLAILLLLTLQARAEHIDCAHIKSQVQQHGKFKAIAWALANGYSPQEISRIRKQCGI